jgi:hypothetical protein
LNVSIGTGNVVSIDTSLPSMSWAPFYVLSNNASSRGDYSSLVVDGDWRYPNQALLTTHGPANQSVLLALTTNSPVLRVTLYDRVTLQRTDSTSVLMASRQGWFLDTFTNTLFMKWESNSTSSLRIEYVPKPPAPPSPIFPESLFVWLFSFLLLAEILALAYLRLSRNRIRMKPGSLAKAYRPFLNMCPPTSMTFSW